MNNIDLSKLKAGNQILLETRECVFEVTLVDAEGNVTISGGKRFLKPTPAKIVGAYGRVEETADTHTIEPLKIHKSLGIQINYERQGVPVEFITSDVVSAKLSGVTDKGPWSFEVWDTEKELKASLDEARARVNSKKKTKVKDEEEENPDEDTVS